MATSNSLRVLIGPSRKVVSAIDMKLACNQVKGTALNVSLSQKSVGVSTDATSAIDGSAWRSMNTSV